MVYTLAVHISSVSFTFFRYTSIRFRLVKWWAAAQYIQEKMRMKHSERFDTFCWSLCSCPRRILNSKVLHRFYRRLVLETKADPCFTWKHFYIFATTKWINNFFGKGLWRNDKNAICLQDIILNALYQLYIVLFVILQTTKPSVSQCLIWITPPTPLPVSCWGLYYGCILIAPMRLSGDEPFRSGCHPWILAWRPEK